MDCAVAGDSVFLKGEPAGVGSRLSQLSLKAHYGFTPGWYGSQLLLFVLTVDVELDQSIFDFRSAEIRNRSFKPKRYVDADALTCKTNFLESAVQRLLLLSGSNGFQWDRWIILLKRRG